MIHAKHDFERTCSHEGTRIQSYRGDNGRFHDSNFVEDNESSNQTISFCNVGAHHQIGVPENKICQLLDLAHSLPFHVKRHWPEAISPMLWPFALKYAAYLLNHTRYDSEGKTAYDQFTGNDHKEDLSQIAVWGCPVYLLDSRLQNPGGKLPKIGTTSAPQDLFRSISLSYLQYAPSIQPVNRLCQSSISHHF